MQSLRVVDPDRIHPRDAARSAVNKFRLDRERERLPICNQSTGAKHLFIDEVIKRTEREMPEEMKSRRRQELVYAVLVFIFLTASFAALFVIAEALR